MLTTQRKTKRHVEDLVIGSETISDVRRTITALLEGWGLERLACGAVQGASELLGNVVKHVDDKACKLTISLYSEPEPEREGHGGEEHAEEIQQPVPEPQVTIAVDDHSPAMPVLIEQDASAEPEELPESGRGMQLIDSIADRWGAEPTADGKRVYFCLRATDG